MASSLAEYVAGLAFGSALFASGVYAPSVITSQLNLSNFHMVKSFMTASAASAIVVYIADQTQHAAMKIRTPQNLGLFTYDGNLLGGAMIGVGMALVGACPGTVLVQAGVQDIKSGTFALLGGVAGGLAYVCTTDCLKRLKTTLSALRHQAETRPNAARRTASPPRRSCHTVLLSTSSSKLPTIQATFNITPLSMLLAWEVLCATVLYLASVFDPALGSTQLAGLITPVWGGLAIGVAQAVSLLLTRHSVGCSRVYQNIGHFIDGIFKHRSIDRAATKYLLEPSVVFAVGIISASALLAKVDPVPATADLTAPIPALTALLGGALMSFGASVANGCTSGHGISGLATFSLASFISVAAMFGGGMLAAPLLS